MFRKIGYSLRSDFSRQLIQLVAPIAFQSFMLSLVSATDAVMLGLVDQTSLSAVSLAGEVQFLVTMTVTAFSGGLGIMAAQYWGKGDRKTVSRVSAIALRYNLFIGLLFTFLALFIPDQLMHLLTNDPDLIASGSGYLLAVAPSYVLCGVSQVYLTLLRNSEKVRTASVISSFAVALNIVANAVLIFGLCGAPRLGIVGAAIATVIARLVELAWAMIESSRPGRIRIHLRELFRFERRLEADFLRYTGPLLLASLVWSIAFALYTVIMGFMGTDAVAANSIASISKSLVTCLTRGMSVGTGIMIGNLLGANEFDRAKDYARRLTIIAVWLGAVTGLLLVVLSPFIVKFAVMSDQARSYLQWMLIIGCINVLGGSINVTVLDGIFCAGGDSTFDAIGNAFAMWMFSVPFGFIAAFVLKWPVPVVYLIVNLDEIVKLPAVFHRYRRYIWLRNITRDQTQALQQEN